MFESHRKLDALIWRYVAEQDYASDFDYNVEDPQRGDLCTRFFHVRRNHIDVGVLWEGDELVDLCEFFEISEFKAWVDRQTA